MTDPLLAVPYSVSFRAENDVSDMGQSMGLLRRKRLLSQKRSMLLKKSCSEAMRAAGERGFSTGLRGLCRCSSTERG
jgi:hypothetical protein